MKARRLFFVFCSIVSVVVADANFSSTCYTFRCNNEKPAISFCTRYENCMPANESLVTSGCSENQNSFATFYHDYGCEGNTTRKQDILGCRYSTSNATSVQNGNQSVIQQTLIEKQQNASYNSTSKPGEWNCTILLYTTETEIHSYNLSSNQTYVLEKESNFTAITASGGYLYYATSASSQQPKQNHIFKIPIIANNSNATKVNSSDFPVTSIAVDYVTNNVYFTTNGSLQVCSNNGESCTTLKCCGIGVVASAPQFGWLFYSYTERKEPSKPYVVRIMRSNMDGSNETTLVYDSETDFVSVIAINEKERYFVYTTRNEMIKFFGLDGGFKEAAIIPQRKYLSVAVTNNMIFYSENDLDGILCGEKFDAAVECFNLTDFRIQDRLIHWNNLYAYNSSLETLIQNPCISAPCEGICLRGGVPSVANATLTFTCPFGNKTETDPDPQINPENSVDVKKKSFGDTLVSAFITWLIVAIVIASVYYALKTYRPNVIHDTVRVLVNQRRRSRERDGDGQTFSLLQEE